MKMCPDHVLYCNCYMNGHGPSGCYYDPIPAGVYWVEANDGFYREDGEVPSGANFMGQAFRYEWWPQRKRFPSK